MAQAVKHKPQNATHRRVWRRCLLLVWFLCSWLWVVSVAERTEIRWAATVYKTHSRYSLKLAEGRATDYERDLYRSYGPRLDAATNHFLSFFLVGIALPALVLAGGTWLLRTRK